MSVHRHRLREILASVYLYNEHRGYTQLQDVLEAVRHRHPDETDFIRAVEHHLADEEKHYRMFRGFFHTRARMPFRVPPECGYVNQIVRRVFRQPVESLDREKVVGDDALFYQLCRLIMITEARGMRQVEDVLRWKCVREDRLLTRIFAVIRDDEPAHCFPYQDWLESRGEACVGSHERWADRFTHWDLMFHRIPRMYANPLLPRLAEFPA